jgi:hypothetical protein
MAFNTSAAPLSAHHCQVDMKSVGFTALHGACPANA